VSLSGASPSLRTGARSSTRRRARSSRAWWWLSRPERRSTSRWRWINVMFTFQKAQRSQRKARIGLIGPSGSGKTYTALTLAAGLAGPGGRIAVIDTENNSAALYADGFEFDVLNLDTFSPEVYVQAIRAAEAAGYDVLISDSRSHARVGKEGAREQGGEAARR